MTDTERLDWMFLHQAIVTSDRDISGRPCLCVPEGCDPKWARDRGWYGETPREAVDAAMKTFRPGL